MSAWVADGNMDEEWLSVAPLELDSQSYYLFSSDEEIHSREEWGIRAGDSCERVYQDLQPSRRFLLERQ